MVGYNPNLQELPAYWYATAGAVSGIVTRVILQPLDVIKIRFQLQEEPIKRCSTSKYYSMCQAASTITKEEGIRALWKGHTPAQILSIAYGVVQFGSFEVLTKKAWRHLPPFLTNQLRPATHFVCGGLSGCAATLVCQPFDVIRTRFIAQGQPNVYHSMAQATRSIIRIDGYKGLYRGLVPTMLQIMPQTGFQFGFYTLFTGMWSSAFEGGATGKPNGAGKTMVCGALAGLCAKTAVYPLDLTKKRLQIQGFGDARKVFGTTSAYTGLFSCLRGVARVEGLPGLFKGLRPSLVKAMFSVALHFSAYEQALKLIRLWRT